MIDCSCRFIYLTNTPATFEEAKEAYEFKIEQYDEKTNEHPDAKEISVQITQILKYVETWFDEKSEDDPTKKNNTYDKSN